VQAIDRIHDILRQLVRRPFPDGRHRDDAGKVRLSVRSLDWEAYVLLATEEIRLAGTGSPQVTRRLTSALIDLRSIAPRERVGVIDRQLEALRNTAEAATDNEWDIEFALSADGKGIGASANSRNGGSSLGH
jgi:uncharacterized membrane protein